MSDYLSANLPFNLPMSEQHSHPIDDAYNPREPVAPQPTTMVTATPFDEAAIKDFALNAVGAGVITLVVVAGSIFVVAGSLKLITWILGGIAGILVAIAPWAAVILGICAFSAFTK